MWKKDVFSVRACLILFEIIFISMITSGCGGKPPQRDFADTDLLIEVADMPEGWDENFYVPNEKHYLEGAVNRARRSFVHTSSSSAIRMYAEQDVYRYRTNVRARNGYFALERQFAQKYFEESPIWETPEGFDFSSPIVEWWYFACDISDSTSMPTIGQGITRCEFLAQYEEFVITFGVTVEEEGERSASLEEVHEIILIIDQKNDRSLAAIDMEKQG